MEESLPDLWLSQDPLPGDPAQIVKKWLDEAFAAGIQANPHAVALATADPDGRPSVRMVLCNEIDPEAAAFTMYTNVDSRKGLGFRTEPRCAIVFHWASRKTGRSLEALRRSPRKRPGSTPAPLGWFHARRRFHRTLGQSRGPNP